MVEVPKIVLEIKLPQETMKSPLAVELVLNAMHNTADGNWWAQYVKGEMRPWYSLELVSFGGQVKFMVWTEARRKDGLIAALYSQFPNISVQEVEDYARLVEFDPEKIKIWSCEMKFTKDNAYPIKTYVDYGLDKDPKEEFKVDPLTPGLEWLGSIKAGQQVWIQMIVRAHKGEQTKEAHKLINEIMKRDENTKVTGAEDEETGMSKKPTNVSGGPRSFRRLEPQYYETRFRCRHQSRIYFSEGSFFRRIRHRRHNFFLQALQYRKPKRFSAERRQMAREIRFPVAGLQKYPPRLFFTESFESLSPPPLFYAAVFEQSAGFKHGRARHDLSFPRLRRRDADNRTHPFKTRGRSGKLADLAFLFIIAV